MLLSYFNSAWLECIRDVLVYANYLVPKSLLFAIYFMIVGGILPKRQQENMHLWEYLPLIVLVAYFEIRGSYHSYFATLALIFIIFNIILYAVFNNKKILRKHISEVIEFSIIKSFIYTIIFTPIVYISAASGNGWYLYAFITTYALMAVVIWRLLLAAKLFKVVIFLRIIILCMLLTILISYAGHCVVLIKNIDNLFANGETVSLSGSAIFTIMAIISILLFSISMFKHIFFNKYNNEFVLFLRCFKFDNSTQHDEVVHFLTQIFKDCYNILQVGNPKKILTGHYEYDTLYLPDTNWQDIVKSYISRATVILLVIDNTNGVLWEMLKHCNYRDKYIYYLPFGTDIDKVFSAQEFQLECKIGNPIAGLFLLNQKLLKGGQYFFFHNEKIVYSDIVFDIIEKYVSIYHLNHQNEIIDRCTQYLREPPIYIKPHESLINILSNIDIKSLYKL